MENVKIKDKEFALFIPEAKILEQIGRVAEEINRDLADKNPLFVCVLNGAFMFAADLMKRVDIPSEISFVKLSSYKGTTSTGKLKELIGLQEDIEGRSVVIVEDIVDTGHTMVSVIEQLKQKNPSDVRVATLLYKPNALKVELKLEYVAMEIPNDFILGYGLDYDGYGRNLSDIYKIVD
ncbi:MAG: hypoxanthine phosphoribosyltransferase [Bacteroidetes bacterium]|jgi:hypoxanthine phosphoribosyltransferase|nr:hypoxanthine phosphoribosyltransferase [Bacteroidota bacterium]